MKNLSTPLKDRVLRYDGTSIVAPEKVVEFLLDGADINQLAVTHLSEAVEQFNANSNQTLGVMGDVPVTLTYDWVLEEPHASLTLQDIQDRLVARLDVNDPRLQERMDRLALELGEFETRGLIPALRAIIYVIDTFTKNDIVWGVGRGSSCASYVLFLLNLHLVDPILYDIPLTEFMHD